MKKFIVTALFAMVAMLCIAAISDFGTAIALAWSPVAFDRNMFKAVRDWAKTQNITATPEPSYLRVEKSFVNGQGSYDFNLKVESGQNILEKKLERNDVFACTHLMVYLLKQDDDQIGHGLLQTYPNTTVFSSASAYDLTDLQAVYSGYLRIKTEQVVNAESIPMVKFLNVPETQQSSSSNKSMFNVGEHGWYPGNIFFFKGWSSLEVNIIFPSWSGQTTQTGESGFTTKLVFHPYGFLLKSAIQGR